MIIFDTNAVFRLPPEGPRADLIRKLRESRHHRVAVPWMVLEEMAAHQAKTYVEKHNAAVGALQKLRHDLPWSLESSLEPLDLERLLNHWRSTYGEIFEVIETSGEVALRALAREAMALQPAKRVKDHSEGARDAAIWFSILEFLKDNPEEHVCFVTNNTNDFGDGTAYRYPMDEDVRGFEDRLTRLEDFDQVISQFTKEVSGADAEKAAWDLLSSLPIQSRVVQAAVEILSSRTGFTGLGASAAEVAWSSWAALPDAELLRVENVVGHEIEGDIWYTARARWLLYGVAAVGDDAQSIACEWGVKILFSASEEDQTPTLLNVEDPELPDAAEERSKEVLKKLEKKATIAARRTPDSFSVYSSLNETSLAQQLAAAMPKFDLTGLNLAQQNLAQLAAAMPKFDLTGLNLAQQNLAQLAAAMPKFDIAGINLTHQNLAQQIAAATPKLDFPPGGLTTGLERQTNSSSDEEAKSTKDEETEDG